MSANFNFFKPQRTAAASRNWSYKTYYTVVVLWCIKLQDSTFAVEIVDSPTLLTMWRKLFEVKIQPLHLPAGVHVGFESLESLFHDWRTTNLQFSTLAVYLDYVD